MRLVNLEVAVDNPDVEAQLLALTTETFVAGQGILEGEGQLVK